MQDVEGKVAFITGGASGIGFGMARVFLRAGMKVVIADRRDDHIAAAKAALPGANNVHFIKVDVTDRDAMERAADETERVFGKVHVVCNNAGVAIPGGTKRNSWDDWDWGLSVNLGGVVNGVKVFLDRILKHGEGGHIVNTASVAAVLPGSSSAIYSTTKAAVLALSESLAGELKGDNIRVTALCPGPVVSNIHESRFNRLDKFKGDIGAPDVEQTLLDRKVNPVWMEATEAGEMVLDAIRRNLMYVFTHNDFREGVEERFKAQLAAFPEGEIDRERAGKLGFPVKNPMYAEILKRGETPAKGGEE